MVAEGFCTGCMNSLKSMADADGWQWYEFAPMKLKDSFTFDFKPGRFAKGGGRTAVDAVYFDRMEIRAE